MTTGAALKHCRKENADMLAAIKQADQHISELVETILVLSPRKVRREDWGEKARSIIRDTAP